MKSDKISVILLISFLGISVCAANVEAKSTHRELESIVEKIGDDTEDFIEEYEEFLEDSGRWKAVGMDLELLDNARILYKEAIRLEDSLDKKKSLVRLEADVSRLLRRGRDITGLLEIVSPDEAVRVFWFSIKDGLGELEEIFFRGGDTTEDSSKLEGSEATETAEPSEATEIIISRGRKFSEMDVDVAWHLIRELDQKSHQMEEMFEADRLFIQFAGATSDFRNAFRKTKNKIKAEPELLTIFRLAEDVENLIQEGNVSPDFETFWQEVRKILDGLVEIYDLEDVYGEEI